MRFSGSMRFSIDPREEETLARMANDDGEMSDCGGVGGGAGGSSEFLEDITSDSFKIGGPWRSGSASSWARNMTGYPTRRNYSPNLYKFAWAQAVQNKPLGLGMSPSGAVEVVLPAKEDSALVSREKQQDDGEKEEGELEEGEIELGSESSTGEMEVCLDSNKIEDGLEEQTNVVVAEEVGMGEFDNHVSFILEELETITEQEVEKSFEDSCSRLRKCFESLKLMFTDERSPVVDALVQQAFMAIQTVHSVYCSWRPEKMKQTKHLFLRLLVHIKNQYRFLLAPDQMKEIDDVVHSLAFKDPEDSMPHEKTAISSKVLNLPEKQISYPEKTVSTDKIGKSTLLKVDLLTASRSRLEFSPLLDLHADYDEGSLPSPTRGSMAPFPLLNPIGIETESVKKSSEALLSKSVITQGSSIPLYDTDALNAVTSYQQRYHKTNSVQANRLPSPTPSEDVSDDDDNLREVTSTKVVANSRIVDVVNSQAEASCSSSFAVTPIVQLLAPVKSAQQSSLSTNHINKPARGRDPRLRIAQSQTSAPAQSIHAMSGDLNVQEKDPVGATLNHRKQRAHENTSFSEHSLKRPRYISADSPGIQVNSGRGWLEEHVTVAAQVDEQVHRGTENKGSIGKPNNKLVNSTGTEANIKTSVSNVGYGQNTMATAVPSLSLPALIQNIAVNPTMLVELIMEQKKLATGTQHLTLDSSQFPNISSSQIASAHGARVSTNVSEIAQNQAGRSQMSPATFFSPNSQSDTVMVRMKPRDPRRILQHNNIQKTNITFSEQIKRIVSPDAHVNKDLSKVIEKAEETQSAVLPSQIIPDIAGQLMKKPMNVSNMMTTSQLTSPQLVGPIQSTSQSVLSTKSKIISFPTLADPSDPKSTLGSSSQWSSAGVFQSPSAWGDMDHILDIYDEQQKAAIQKERARRIEEQNKMFCARKLSLVLDIDHTLLNSAKFAEVDPAHDEVLRIKEEQDREKPLRHLFRFQHMGMWTKLRPGIWNFLDKASKLYELHLYTMGNKLYATEMAKVLDPTGSLFSGRVISRGDDSDSIDGDERTPKSKDLDGVLGMESAVVIIDDSVKVWPLNKLNLIVVERYTFFPSSRRQFCLPGPSLLEVDHDERPEDGTLASSLAVIERIHQIFFSHRALNDADVRIILSAEQRKILAGCRIVFSRIFPVGEANPHLHPLWQTAEQFGAVCTNQIDEQVTHVVANSLGTDKVNWALSTGRFVVKVGWVEASALLYRRASEQEFAIKP